MNDLWLDFQNRSVLILGLLATAFAVALYCAFIVIWRHDPTFVPGIGVYMVTFILLGVSIGLCYRGAKV